MARRKQAHNPYGCMNHHNSRGSNDVTRGMVDVSKMVVAGAVTIGTIGVMGNLLSGLK